jgi:beta-aspartyl-peptidase (threonine type)
MPLRLRRTIPPAVLLLVLAGAGPARAAGDPGDSLARALADPFASSLAPTVCVVPEDLDARAVRQLLDAQVAAWNRGDLEGFLRGYWRSDSLSFYSGGSVTHGWQTTLDRYRRRYQGEGREMGTLVFDVHDVALPARGLAVVRGGWSLALKESRPAGLFTLLLRWFPDDGWKVVHDHTSVAPATP